MKYIIMMLMMVLQPVASATDFIVNFGDVPLMEGLAELEDERVVFDTGAGTIAETVLVGKMKAAAVLKFYTESLKQLGWEKINAGSTVKRLAFRREQQFLSLRAFDSAGAVSLIIHLEPVKE